MRLPKLLAAAATASVLLVGGSAIAAPVVATTDLNMRAGPGSGYPVVGVIGAHHPVTVMGCNDAQTWCTIHYNGQEGWASSRYLADAGAGPAVIHTPGILSGPGTATGTATGAVTGAVIGGPVGAVIGGVAGYAVGSEIDRPRGAY